MFKLAPLPYAHDALDPFMSAETLKLHHGKHHQAYIDKLNALVEATPMAGQSLEDVILATHEQADAEQKKLFNNAAQAWNHDCFWHSMRPGGGGKPEGELADLIDRDLGGYDAFAKDFSTQAAEHFGSGWAWLVFGNDRLDVVTTHDADLPLVHGQVALLVCDLWEHAYYVDYRNKRPDFIAAFLENLVDWDRAAERLEAAETLHEVA